MKEKKFLLMALILVGNLFSFTNIMAKPIELSLGLIIPPKHLCNIHVFEPWIKIIEEKIMEL